MASQTCGEKIWANAERKLEGISGDIILAASGGVSVLVIAHFESTLSRVAAHLREKSIDYHAFFPGDQADLCNMKGSYERAKVWLAAALYFQPGNLSTVSKSDDAELSVLIAEHHPMANKDDILIEGVRGLPCHCRIVFHAALTDALLMYFGGERLKSLLKRLGHDESTYLSHPMVSAAIRNAQKKISKQVHQEVRTLSDEEWFKYNLRNSGQ